jgi:hypothetical protein
MRAAIISFVNQIFLVKLIHTYDNTDSFKFTRRWENDRSHTNIVSGENQFKEKGNCNESFEIKCFIYTFLP